MAGGPLKRRRGARIGVAVAIAAAVAVSLGLFQSAAEPARPREETGFGTIRADGKVILRVVAPILY
jgi:hypothetical protein